MNDIEINSNKITEYDVQNKLERELGCGHRKCNAGIIDIFTPTTIIEIKNWKQWKNALGQIFAYSYDFPDKDKRVHFFGKMLDIDTMLYIICLFMYYNVNVTWEREDIKKCEYSANCNNIINGDEKICEVCLNEYREIVTSKYSLGLKNLYLNLHEKTSDNKIKYNYKSYSTVYTNFFNKNNLNDLYKCLKKEDRSFKSNYDPILNNISYHWKYIIEIFANKCIFHNYEFDIIFWISKRKLKKENNNYFISYEEKFEEINIEDAVIFYIKERKSLICSCLFMLVQLKEFYPNNFKLEQEINFIIKRFQKSYKYSKEKNIKRFLIKMKG